MKDHEILVAVISPWGRLSQLVKRKFRVESLPAEKKVMVWRKDLQTEAGLRAELEAAGVTEMEIVRRFVTTGWKDVE